MGGGAIMRNKRPAEENIGLDLSASSIAAFDDFGSGDAHFSFHEWDALVWLDEQFFERDTLIYCDPPYLPETRVKPKVYEYEMSYQDHVRFLDIACDLDCMVMISGYESDLYANYLYDWPMIQFQAMTRGGPRTECLWMNFPPPLELHDYQYLGEDFRERERIKRKKTRWASKWRSMPLLERRAIMAAIREAEASP